MMNRSLTLLKVAVVVLVDLILSLSDLNAQEFGRITFTCPPCGCDGDTLSVSTVRNCPDCGMEMVEQSELSNVAVLIYNGVQLADLAGAYSVFEAARTFQVYTVAATAERIETYLCPVSIVPRYTFDNCPKPDILIIPGGGVGRQIRDQRLIGWVEDNARRSRIVLSVCTGAFILAKTGLLDKLSSTVLEEDIDQLKRTAPNVNVVSGRAFVDNGKYMSAAGPTSGIGASLHILTKIFGSDRRARQVARFLDYTCQPE